MGVVDLRQQIDIRHAGRLAEREWPGRAGNHRFNRVKTLRDPVPRPFLHGLLRLTQLILEIEQDAQILDGMGVAADNRSNCPDLCAQERIFRQQRGLRPGFLDPFQYRR